MTLFRPDGSLDASATAAHARQLVDRGVAALVVAGTTGEASTLGPDERDEVLAAVRERVDDVPVIAGTGASSARQTATLTSRARERGADAVLVLSPPRVSDVAPYYDAVAEAAGSLPVLAYHFPAVSPPGIPVEMLSKLPIAGCKDSTGDANRLLETLDSVDLPLYTGSAAVLALAGPLGCAGAILGLANVEPEQCAAAFSGDAQAQRALTQAHLASKSRFPHGLKELAAERLGTSAVARLP